VLQAASVVNLFFEIITWLVIIRVILSWIPHNPNNPLLRILYEGTEPVLAPFRRIMPQGMMLDLSPILALIVLQMLRQAIIRMLLRM